jgi:GNAT superfamily N-acetyltransferase
VNLTIRRAGPDDLDVITEIQAESVEWLASKGLDQWQPGQPQAPQDRPWSHLQESIERGNCWVVEAKDEIVATITVDDYADPEFWDTEDADQAFYVHRMIVRRSHAGRNLGATLLAWADHLARAANRRYLRLDAWQTNEPLHRYYESQGFTHLRTLELSHRGSGALFQRPVAPKTGDQLRRQPDGSTMSCIP